MCDNMAGAVEAVQVSKGLLNETGLPIEPFNLDKEREEGTFDAGAGYPPASLKSKAPGLKA